MRIKQKCLIIKVIMLECKEILNGPKNRYTFLYGKYHINVIIKYTTISFVFWYKIWRGLYIHASMLQ